MAKKKNMTRNRNHDGHASSKKKVNTGTDDAGGSPWSDLIHHMLYLVMMKLGVVDYLSFGGVCKSWRTLAVSNRCAFMASIPPMAMRITWHGFKKACCLEDFEGRKFKTILSRSDSGAYVGLTCGYLIFFKKTTGEFCLVNPITRHEFYFPNFNNTSRFCASDRYGMKDARAILVFSLSIFEWVFLIIPHYMNTMWFSIAGTGAWNRIFCLDYLFTDIRVFKGIIYTLNKNFNDRLCDRLYELRLSPEPKLTLVETKNSLNPSGQFSQLVSSGDNLYVMERVQENRMLRTPEDSYRFQELDFGEMKWVSRKKKLGEHASFLSNVKYGVVEKRVWIEKLGQCILQGHDAGEMLKLIELEKSSSFKANIWYFPHECLNVDLVNE